MYERRDMYEHERRLQLEARLHRGDAACRPERIANAEAAKRPRLALRLRRLREMGLREMER